MLIIEGLSPLDDVHTNLISARTEALIDDASRSNFGKPSCVARLRRWPGRLALKRNGGDERENA